MNLNYEEVTVLRMLVIEKPIQVRDLDLDFLRVYVDAVC